MMVFSDLPFSYTEQIEAYFEAVNNDQGMSMEVQMFLPSPEKLTVEMVAGEGDIYLVEKSLFPIIFDPVILHPLDSIGAVVEEENQHIGTNEQTGEEHVYAITVNSDTSFFQHLEIAEPSSYIAVMIKERPFYSYGLNLLEAMIDGES
ncbi:hypothetical protein AJ85_19410 [Alkalihalobacillus alcalophilus ATCC 27647 = CGMCC 1.3604]|nr:hypothetical protein [Alkalihalobacillus alcalophilus]MED1561991.1 hypothetical protein [Alkalihalobacillus alcalophilus]THG89139.1 hypothetical protein AJ85_19410 [Alkalihalobacillus alcalophilus ATCC 27647 = CGMCC 1.3604]